MASNLAMTISYCCLSSNVVFVDSKTASTSSPRQYRSVLTFLGAVATDRMEAS